jgi:hypothetical protein
MGKRMAPWPRGEAGNRPNHEQDADSHCEGSRGPDHVLAQHARIDTSDQNAAGVRAASIRESTKDGGRAAVQQPPGVPGTTAVACDGLYEGVYADIYQRKPSTSGNNYHTSSSTSAPKRNPRPGCQTTSSTDSWRYVLFSLLGKRIGWMLTHACRVATNRALCSWSEDKPTTRFGVYS